MISIVDCVDPSASVTLKFSIWKLRSKHINYKSSLWKKMFADLVDDQIKDVSCKLC